MKTSKLIRSLITLLVILSFTPLIQGGCGGGSSGGGSAPVTPEVTTDTGDNHSTVQDDPLALIELTDFYVMFDEYEMVFVKSDYETQDEYEQRVIEYFSGEEEVKYFEIYVDDSYDAETSTLLLYMDKNTDIPDEITVENGGVIFPIPATYGDRDEEGFIHTNNATPVYLPTISNPGPFYSSDVYQLSEVIMDSSSAEDLTGSYEMIIGVRFSYKTNMLYSDLDVWRSDYCWDADHCYEYYFDYYQHIVGELVEMRVYSDISNEVFVEEFY